MFFIWRVNGFRPFITSFGSGVKKPEHILSFSTFCQIEICPKTTFTDFLRLCSRILPLSGVNAESDPKAFWKPKCTFDMSSSEVQEMHDFLVFLHRKRLIQGRGNPTCLSKVSLEHIWYIEFSKSSRNACFSRFFGPKRADTGAQKSKISLKSKFGTHLICQLSRSSKNAWFSRFSGPKRADTGAQKSKISLKSKFGPHKSNFRGGGTGLFDEENSKKHDFS